jgi:hypothetical protein
MRHPGSFKPVSIANRQSEIQIVDTHESAETRVSPGFAALLTSNEPDTTDQLMTKYFPDAKFSEQNRPLFAFASYNCGPGNISKMRKEAASRGLDPDKWFNNVEVVTAEKIGIETTTYVRNIYKY